MRPARRTQRQMLRSAFTLIEILIAITVLAIGLLGLGAVFPVVIREQRLAITQMEAPSALAQAEAVLRANRALGTVDPNQGVAPTDPGYEDGSRWSRFVDQQSPSAMEFFFLPSNQSMPTAPFDDVNDWLDPATGDMEFDWGGGANTEVDIALAQRMIPPPEINGPDPEYVWDFVLFRPNDDTLQAVVFLRSIDLNIRIPNRSRDDDTDLGRLRLADVLLERFGVSATERRVPIAVNDSGRPTGDGTGEYAPILPATLSFIKMFQINREREQADVLVLDLSDHGDWPSNKSSLITRVGQRLVVHDRVTNRLSTHVVLGATESDAVTLTQDEVAVRVRPALPVPDLTAFASYGGYEAAIYSPIPPAGIAIVDLEVRP
ncbi:MAG: prepilin-type N-terminal cleavage/methylation domain-containing protein [Planctomycetota bacterium]